MAIVRPFLLLSFLLVLFSQPSFAAEPAKKSAVIKLDHGTDDLHSVFMGLKIGKLLLKKKQAVTLFLNLEAVRLVDVNQPVDIKWGHSPQTVGQLLSSFVKAGGKVLVCPHCAKAAGVKKLRKGAKIANESEVADLFAMADKVITY